MSSTCMERLAISEEERDRGGSGEEKDGMFRSRCCRSGTGKGVAASMVIRTKVLYKVANERRSVMKCNEVDGGTLLKASLECGASRASVM